MQPDLAWTHAVPCQNFDRSGQEVQRRLKRPNVESIRSLPTGVLSIALQGAGRKADADKSLQVLLGEWSDTAAYYIAQVYAYRGENDRALEWLERAYRQKDVGLDEIVGEQLFSELSSDPRYKAFLRKMNLPETTARSAP